MHQDDARITRPCPFVACQPELDARGVCRACSKPVVDLSAGTEADARAFRASGARACVAYVTDTSGRVRFGQRALTGALVLAAGGTVVVAPRLEPADPGAPIEAVVERTETSQAEGAPPDGDDQQDFVLLGYVDY